MSPCDRGFNRGPRAGDALAGAAAVLTAKSVSRRVATDQLDHDGPPSGNPAS